VLAEDFDGEDRKGGKGGHGDKKGKYKCRLCGEIKKQHVCPYLEDVPRIATHTIVDADLTVGRGTELSSD
jgi:hypothetical protein